ncbi:MATE family efflux transporter [Clostridium sp.]|uniref:MATE family efflux transporter n=1 Tax=Clostridium sp. TaxID=1506 RepID=UPI00260BC469|nr:MATE family efflux transporter [Clostridium sp.]
MKDYKNDNLGTGKISKLLFALAIPAITAQIINVLYNVVDRIYIGHIPSVGADALTGIGVTFPLIMIISAFASLIGMGGAPRAAIMMGKNENDSAEEILGNSVSTLIIISVVLTIAFLIFNDKLLLLFGASENTLPYASSYMNIYTFGTLFVQISLGLNMFITTQGFAKTSMMTVVIGAIINIILDPIFIFIFKMGVQGAALATVISQGISAIWVLKFLVGKKTILKIKRQYLGIRFSVIFPVLALGISPFIMQSTESILMICFNFSLLKYGGDLAVGAMAILASVMQFTLMPVIGLTQGAQPIISYNYGAKNSDRVKKAFKLLLFSSILYSLLIWVLIMVTPSMFASLFTDNAELITMASWSLKVYMSASFLMSIQFACQQTFIALGNAKASLFLALLRKIFLLIPMIFILPQFITNKVFAIFLAEPVSDTIAVTVTIILFSIQFNKSLKEMEL